MFLPDAPSNMAFEKITESDSPYRNLETLAAETILTQINKEDKTIAAVIEKAIPQIESLVVAIVEKMQAGGRLFYIGAGTSGRLGILDASECQPTFGIAEGLVTGIIAGGSKALYNPVEFAEDNENQGWKDLQDHAINALDVVIGLSASGTTPYVIAALSQCRVNGILTGSITCNPQNPLSEISHHPIELVVGPEFITGSTRMKAGTSQKMALNMISTTVMIKLGRVEDNKMINMQLTNSKLVDRGVKMAMNAIGEEDYDIVKKLLIQFGSVKKLIENYHR
ncbi:MAG: N-acetylmuramic acid 6-phosphate etherase [Dyadobacter sp.]